MEHFSLQTLYETYFYAIQQKNTPLERWCYFIFKKGSESLGVAFAKLKMDAVANNFIAASDEFYFVIKVPEISFEYRYTDDFYKGIFVCYVEL